MKYRRNLIKSIELYAPQGNFWAGWGQLVDKNQIKNGFKSINEYEDMYVYWINPKSQILVLLEIDFCILFYN